MFDGVGQSAADSLHRWQAPTVIILTALVTYVLRFGGLLLAGHLLERPAFKKFLDVLPGTVLISLVVPGIVHEGFWGVVAAALIVVCVRLTQNVFLAMVTGMAVVALARAF